MSKYFVTIIVFTLSFFLFQPYSYSEITQSEWDTVYNLTEDYVRQGKWEEAQASLWYLKDCIKDLIVPNDGQYRSQDLDQLDFRVSTLVNQKLESLYQEGQNQLNNSEFSKALMTFRKILYYYPDYQNVRYLSWKTQSLSNISRGINQKTVVVTSETPNKRQTGLRVYKPEKCFNGYTLFHHQALEKFWSSQIHYTYLIDMNGNIIHKWLTNDVTQVRLKANNNLVYSGAELREIDYHSNIIWHYLRGSDHDFQILENGYLLLKNGEQLNIDMRSRHPRIEIITPDKKIIWQWKAEEHIEELKNLLGLKILPLGDWAHVNACEIIKDNPSGKKDNRFRKNNIIFSYADIDTIGIIDYETGNIVWAWGPGIVQGQHTPAMLDNGNLLIFDNGERRGWSRVIELNPLTEQIVWEYHAEPKEDFFTKEMGSAFKLPNGNILVCESISNRFFEITPNGEIVWDFISTFNKTIGAGEGIYRAYRYSPEYVQPLLDKIDQWQNKHSMQNRLDD